MVVNKVLLKLGNTYNFLKATHYFQGTKVELNSCNKDGMGHKSYNIYYPGIYNKWLNHTMPVIFWRVCVI